MPTSTRTRMLLAVGALLLVGAAGGATAVALLTMTAQAEVGSTDRTTADCGDESSDFVVPYDGYLMLDSTPLNGGIELQFELYEFDPGINNIAASPEWTETQTITAYNGRFSVGLGSTTPINQTLLDADQLFLSIAVSDGAGGFVPLGGYQAIEPVPYAIWSAHAANLNVAGTLATGGSATLGDDVTDNTTVAGALSTGRSLTVGNSATNAWLFATGTDFYLGTANNSGRGNGGRALVQLGGDTLAVNYQSDFSGGTLMYGPVTAASTLNVNGNTTLGTQTTNTVTTTGDLTVGGDLTFNGALEGWNLVGPYTVTRQSGGTAATVTSNMIPLNAGFCFLTKAFVEGGGERDYPTGCQLLTDTSNWRVQAYTELGISTGRATCQAYCIRLDGL